MILLPLLTALDIESRVVRREVDFLTAAIATASPDELDRILERLTEIRARARGVVRQLTELGRRP